MEEKKPYLVVLLINAIYAGMYIISKAAFNDGMSTYVFVFYRQALATIFLAPVALFLERKKAPPISFKILIKIFVLALIGITFSLDLYNVALNYTSATVASATTNSVPVITFFFAVVLGMESLKLRALAGALKVLGIALCLAGITTIAFYAGPYLQPHLFHLRLSSHDYAGRGVSNSNPEDAAAWVKGTFLMITANSAWSLWLVMQGKVMADYPSKLLFTTWQCLFSAIQTFVVAVAVERDFSKWRLGLDLGLVAVAYCGIVVTGISFYLQAWCIEKKGPVFMSMSSPLALVITILISTLLLGEAVGLGSIFGGVLMVGGLYSVLWGKSKEKKDMKLPIVAGSGKEGFEEPTTEELVVASPFHP